MRTILLVTNILLSLSLVAQPPQASIYTINNIMLEANLHKQVCISGMKYFNKSLYFASERCPIVYAVNPENPRIMKWRA